ncbi:fungal-specific transcription factor domain-containing protein [Xylogone sp. PMI_703]|nr:fungal-specific transcription factor domain-containing protein [Xylogone sp. PMI_703]
MEISDSSQGSRQDARRRNLGSTCNECHYRKVRCDGNKPTCGPCLTRGRSFTCSYSLSPDKEKQRDIFGYLDRLERDLYNLKRSQLVGSFQNASQPAQAPTKDSVLDNSDIARPYGHQVFRESLTTYPDPSLSANTLPSASLIDQTLHSDGLRGQYKCDFGCTSTIGFIRQLQVIPTIAQLQDTIHGENLKSSSLSGYFTSSLEDQMIKEPSSFGLVGIPDSVGSRHMLAHLMDTYFARLHIIHPFLHQPTWQGKQVAQDLMNGAADLNYSRLSMALANMVFALGALYSHKMATDEALSISEHFFLSAKREIGLEQLETPSLELAQCLLLMTQYSTERCLFSSGHLHSTLTYLSLAIRVCRSLGLDRDSTRITSCIVREVGKRLWWGCVYFDITLSTHFGQRLIINQHEYSTDLPAVVDDEFITHKKIQAQPPTKTSKMTCFVAAIHLAQILRRINNDIYLKSRKPTGNENCAFEVKDYNSIRSLESALDEWRKSLPTELQIADPSRSPIKSTNLTFLDRQVLCLYVRYHYARVLLYRCMLSLLLTSPWQGKPPSPATLQASETSDSITVHYATSCFSTAVDVIQYFHARMEHTTISIFRGWTYGLLYVYTMISVLIASKCCRNEKVFNPDVLLRAWTQAVEILRFYKRSDELVDIPFDLLEKIDYHIFRNDAGPGDHLAIMPAEGSSLPPRQEPVERSLEATTSEDAVRTSSADAEPDDYTLPPSSEVDFEYLPYWDEVQTVLRWSN